MEKYEIHIGKIFDLKTNTMIPKQILIVTEEQHEVILHFADQRKDAELNTIYKLNECEFSIKPLYTYEK